jgi:DNA-binding NarL/FixJ family response regulator
MPQDDATRALLTATQWLVLAELARGARDDAIAATLGMTPATVRAHLRQIYRRLPLEETRHPRLAAAVWYAHQRARAQ